MWLMMHISYHGNTRICKENDFVDQNNKINVAAYYDFLG